MSYSSAKIFSDSNVNALLDRFMYEALLASGLNALDDKLCLTGRAAATLQGAPPIDCRNIVFITPEITLYKAICAQLPKRMLSNGCVLLKERALFYFDSLYLEVWYTSDTVTAINQSGIYLQQISKIPSILL